MTKFVAVVIPLPQLKVPVPFAVKAVDGEVQVNVALAGLIETTGGVLLWLTVAEAVAVQPFKSVTVTVYVLGELTVFAAVVIPPPQL